MQYYTIQYNTVQYNRTISGGRDLWWSSSPTTWQIQG